MEEVQVLLYGSQEEFMLLPEFVDMAVHNLGLAGRHIGVDLFAAPTLKQCDLFITRDMDSFTFDWGNLYAAQSGLLWANPPFHQLDKLVEKIRREPVEIVICTPERSTTEWWSALESMGKRVSLPRKRRIYQGAYRKQPLSEREWHTAVWYVDTRKTAKSAETATPGRTMADLMTAIRELHTSMCPLPMTHAENLEIVACGRCHKPTLTPTSGKITCVHQEWAKLHPRRK